MEKPKDTPASDEQSPVDEIIPYIEPEVNPSKTGNKPKQLVAVEVFGYEVGRGKNRRIINPDDVYKLAALGCNNQEICTWFDIPKDTLQYTFSEVIEKGREDIKLRLRRAQLDLAINGRNPTMLIWLGKQMLGQTDTPINTDANQPLPWNDNAPE
jgi:hypothetical protein